MSLELVLGKPEVNNLKVEIVKSSLVIDEKLQKEINKDWELFLEDMKRKGIKAWNGKKFRFEKVEGNKVFLSETDFKTNLCLRRLNKMQLRNNVVVITNIVTSDNYLVFGRRKNVGVNPNVIAWIAGGVEPIENSKNVLIDTMQIELKEELGLDINDYELGLNLVYKSIEQSAYYVYFDTKTKFTKDEIVERFKTADENEENSELVFYENTKKGIEQLINNKDMLSEVTEYFTNDYES